MMETENESANAYNPVQGRLEIEQLLGKITPVIDEFEYLYHTGRISKEDAKLFGAELLYAASPLLIMGLSPSTVKSIAEQYIRHEA